MSRNKARKLTQYTIILYFLILQQLQSPTFDGSFLHIKKKPQTLGSHESQCAQCNRITCYSLKNYMFISYAGGKGSLLKTKGYKQKFSGSHRDKLFFNTNLDKRTYNTHFNNKNSTQ